VDEYKSGIPSDAYRKKLKDEAEGLIKAIADELKESGFKILEVEHNIECKIGGLNIRGQVDRIDGRDGYVRIIDYKTGKINPNISDVFYGRQIQLPAYLSVLKQKYKPAGIYYLPVSNDFAKEANSVRYGMIGYTNKKFLTDNDQSYVLEERDFDALCGYTEALIACAAEEAAGGNILPSPSAGACKYCNFFAMCGGSEERPSPAVMLAKFFERCGGAGENNE
jgi:ATP-dependent helicase/DNAse subunit B